VLHAGDPAWTPEPGDRLMLIQERDSFFAAEAASDGTAAPRRDMLTGLYGYRDFLSFFTRARGRSDRGHSARNCLRKQLRLFEKTETIAGASTR
jgi:hypothetical protein